MRVAGGGKEGARWLLRCELQCSLPADGYHRRCQACIATVTHLSRKPGGSKGKNYICLFKILLVFSQNTLG